METRADYNVGTGPAPQPPQRPHLYLMDEHVHSFYPTLAARIGLNEAILLQQIHSWIVTYAKNPKEYQDRHWHDGRWWIWNSVPDWHEVLPYFSNSTIERTLKRLREAGLVLVGNYNTLPIDRTLWYAIDYAAYDRLWADQKTKMVSPSRQNDGMENVNLTGPLPSSSSSFSASLEEPPAAASPPPEEPFYSEGETPTAPTQPHTAEELHARTRQALATFGKNGGKPAVADPSKEKDPWMGDPVKMWCVFVRLPYEQQSPSRLRLFAGDLRDLATTDGFGKTPDDVAAAIRAMAESKSCEWMRTAGRPTHKGFAETLINVLCGQVLPEGGTVVESEQARENQTVMSRLFDENGRRRQPEHVEYEEPAWLGRSG